MALPAILPQQTHGAFGNAAPVGDGFHAVGVTNAPRWSCSTITKEAWIALIIAWFLYATPPHPPLPDPDASFRVA